FSSRRRHTRSKRDWSSDVCSSDLSLNRRDGSRIPVEMTITVTPQGGVVSVARDISERLKAERTHLETEAKYKMFVEQVAAVSYKIGRASGRERVGRFDSVRSF